MIVSKFETRQVTRGNFGYCEKPKIGVWIYKVVLGNEIDIESVKG